MNPRPTHVALAVLLALVVAGASAASGPSYADVVAIVKPAVTLVRVGRSDGQLVGGSGFLIHPDGWILTNYHVVEKARKVWIRFAPSDGGLYDLSGWPSIEATVVAAIRDSDVALLKIPKRHDGLDYPYVWLSDPRLDPVVHGEEVMVFGFPGGLGAESVTATRGIVSATRGPIFQIDAAVNPGNSGGPVVGVERAPAVMGIAFARIPGLQGVNFAVGMEAVIPLLSRIPGGVSFVHRRK